MKRTGIQRPTGEKLEQALRRQRDNRAASVKRSQEKRRQQAAQPPANGKVRTPRKRMREKNPERLAKRRAEAFGPPGFVDWIKALPCAVPACGARDIEAAHARSRGAGGCWEDVLPLCTGHHRMQHTKGIQTFERHVGFSLADVADDVHMRWIECQGEIE